MIHMGEPSGTKENVINHQTKENEDILETQMINKNVPIRQTISLELDVSSLQI